MTGRAYSDVRESLKMAMAVHCVFIPANSSSKKDLDTVVGNVAVARTYS